GIRNFIDMRLSSIGSGEHEVVPGLGQGHRRYDGFVEIIACWAGAAPLNLNTGSVGTEYKDCAFCHLSFSLSLTSKISDVQRLPVDMTARTSDLFRHTRGSSRLISPQTELDSSQCPAT